MMLVIKPSISFSDKIEIFVTIYMIVKKEKREKGKKGKREKGKET